MNKRLVLNVMIIALLTFYMIFNIVYSRISTGSEPEQQTAEVIWEQPFLVPNPWHLIRLEFSSLYLYKADENNWQSNSSQIAPQNTSHINNAAISNIANAWKNLQAMNVEAYDDLPLKGITVLAFVEEDSQPLVFRVLELNNQLKFYRMIDKKLFSFPQLSKSQFIPDSITVTNNAVYRQVN